MNNPHKRKQRPLDYWETAKKTLSRNDPVLKSIIRSYQGEMLVGRVDPFFTIARSIAGQQISVKAAEAVWKRVEALTERFTPQALIQVDDEALRGAGLSRQKIVYMKGLAERCVQDNWHQADWHALSDEEAARHLTSLKGVGQWTAEMFLIFHMGRPDIFPIGDLGLQKAIIRHYFKGRKVKPERMMKLAQAWRPWRSVATWYLWRSLDPMPVEY